MSLKKIFDKWFYINAVFCYGTGAFFILAIISNDGVMTINGVETETNKYLVSFYIFVFSTLLTFLLSWGARTILNFYFNALLKFFGYKNSKNNADS